MAKVLVPWVMGKAIGLIAGVYLGALLAIAIVGGGPIIWLHLARGDLGMVAAAEWAVAVGCAWYIAGAGIIVWTGLAWRRLNGYIAASIVGFLLSASTASLFFWDADGTILARVGLCSALGFAGAAAGLASLAIDRTLMRVFGLRASPTWI